VDHRHPRYTATVCAATSAIRRSQLRRWCAARSPGTRR